MSAGSVELVLSWYERYWSQGDFFGSVEAWDPEVEVRLSTDFLEPMVGRGFGGLAELMRNWLGAWEDYRVFPEEYIETDPNRVVVVQRGEGRGRGSDLPMEGREICVYTLRNERIVKFEVYRHRGTILEAAGLTE